MFGMVHRTSAHNGEFSTDFEEDFEDGTNIKRDASSLPKLQAQEAPKRFKSSYIKFFEEKKQEIRTELGPSATASFQYDKS